MAFTSAQKTSIRFYCGWTARFVQTDTRLEQAISSAENDADVTTQIVALLASLSDIDTKLVDAHKRIKVNKVGSIELPGQMELMSLRSEGRRFAGRLASILGVPIRNDVFSGVPPKNFQTLVGPFGGMGSSGGGNLPPLG